MQHASTSTAPVTPTTPGGPGQTLFHFVRTWSRRWDAAGAPIDRERGRDVQVCEAVLAATATATRGATINAIAAELGLDQSGASRMVEQAARHGYLCKTTPTAGSGDGRARLVAITPAGEALVADARAWQEAVFARLTTDWSPSEVATFTALMQRLAQAHLAPHAADRD